MVSARIIEGGNQGYWSPRSATLDWCEENYVVLSYIAEFWNSFSNFGFILLSLISLYRVYRYRLEKRFVVAYLAVLLVGVGSFSFHATLLYEMQLLDEIPMLFLAAALYYLCLEKRKEKMYGFLAPVLLVTFCVLTTVLYVKLKLPVFHHVTYLALSVLTIIESFQLSRKIDPVVSKLLVKGSVVASTGFLIWNIDNIFCDSLRGTRNAIIDSLRESLPLGGSAVGHLLSSVFQFHAWWHILTGIGGYLVILFLEYYRMTLGKIGNFDKGDTHNAYTYHSLLTTMDNGRRVQVGISFWMGLLPYTWCQDCPDASHGKQAEFIAKMQRRYGSESDISIYRSRKR